MLKSSSEHFLRLHFIYVKMNGKASHYQPYLFFFLCLTMLRTYVIKDIGYLTI